MPNALNVSADVALLLLRQALCDYALACEAAQIAAEHCGRAENPATDALGELRECRLALSDAEHALNVAVDLATGDAGDITFDKRHRDRIGALTATTLSRIRSDFESSEKEILDAGQTIQRLRALLDELPLDAAEQPSTGTRSPPVQPRT